MTDHQNQNQNENQADLTVLTRGREIDLGWTKNDEGNWSPPLWDRRRLAVGELSILAMMFGGFVPLQALPGIASHHSVSKADEKELFGELTRWIQLNSEPAEE